MTAIARRGLRKVTMTDIGESAAVSRGTLYRYFASKDDVLNALPDFLQRRWERDIRAAVADRPESADRLRVVMDAIIGYADTAPESLRLIRQEPAFGLTMLARNLPAAVRAVTDLLAPVIEEAAVVRDRAVTGPELAEIMLRVGMSGYLVPTTHTWQLGTRMAGVWDFLNTNEKIEAGTATEPDRVANVADMPRRRGA